MTDHGYILGSAIATQLQKAGIQGRRRLPERAHPAIDHLQRELWRDLMRPGPLWSNIRLIDEGSDLHPRKFMAGRIGDGLIVHSYIDTDKIAQYLMDGATLIYNHLQESSRTVQRLQETLEYQLNARVWIQAYLTRASGSAFGMHVDDHNFIVLQVVGAKAWGIATSLAGDTVPSSEDVTLTAGDVMALPSNTPHRGSAAPGSLSLHLTIAFDWLDGDAAGSVIPSDEADSHRAAARIGSTIPLSLCSEVGTEHLPFRFRDRVRPKLSTDSRGTLIECHSGSFLIDARFGVVAADLATGSELTKMEVINLAPHLGENDIDKFLRFGVENEILSCSG